MPRAIGAKAKLRTRPEATYGVAPWQAAIACTVPSAFGSMTLDIAGTLALAAALGADVGTIAALLPDIRAGLMAGLTKAQREADRDG